MAALSFCGERGQQGVELLLAAEGAAAGDDDAGGGEVGPVRFHRAILDEADEARIVGGGDGNDLGAAHRPAPRQRRWRGR